MDNLKEIKEYAIINNLISDFNKKCFILENELKKKNKIIKLLKTRNTTLRLKLNNALNDTNLMLEKLKVYLKNNGLSKELLEILDPYLKSLDYQMLEDEYDDENSNANKIGYCKIENNKHYIVFSNKKYAEILNIPENTYIAEKQFVLVDNKNNFKWVYPYCYNEHSNEIANIFGIAINKDDKWFIYTGKHELSEIHIPQHITLNDKQVVLIDSDNNLIRYYKPIKFIADLYMKSIKAKGCYAAYVLKILNKGYLIRNIETGEEFVITPELPDGIEGSINEQNIVIVKNNKVTNVFSNYKFYTLSKYYKNIEYGTIEIEEEKVFLRKISGEKVLVNNIPSTLELQDGQVIGIDEFNNFAILDNSCLETSITSVVTHIKKNIKTNKNKVNYYDKIEEINKNVLIIGNIRYKNSYKLNLLKYGYRAEVIEGFEPWAKISSLAKKIEANIIVVVVNHISHDNQEKVKREFSEIPIIFAESDGANRIISRIIELEKEQEENQNIN